MPNNAVSSLIDADHAAFMQAGVSISVAGCGERNMPSQARATGCRISADRLQVTLFLSATQAARLLADIRDNGAIAVVFSQPSTHRTVQLKGRDARIVGIADTDLDIVERYRDAFVAELQPLGFDAALIRTLLSYPPQDIVAVAFTPAEAFSQTPGPHAGEPLKPLKERA
jgi:hypothetical protein